MTIFLQVDDAHADESAGFADVVLRLSQVSDQRITVEYALGDGTARRDSDFANVLGVASFDPGVTSRTVRVPLLNDNQAEALETFQFSLNNPIGVTATLRAATIFIHDNDRLSGTPFVSVRDISVDEGQAQARFVVTLDRPSAGVVDIDYASDSGSAESGVDFTPVSGTLHFEPGQVLGIVDVPLINDNQTEADEIFGLRLLSSRGGVLVSPRGTAVIVANDAPAQLHPSLRVIGEDINEADGYGELVLALSAPGSQPVGVTLTTSSAWQGSTPGSDFPVPQSYTIVLVPGQTTTHLPFLISNDDLAEALESLVINTTVAGEPGLGTIETLMFVRDDDAARDTPAILLHDITVDERDGVARVVVALSQPSTSTVSVEWATQPGSAQGGADYLADSGRLSFAPGQQVRTLYIPLIDDSQPEGDESFSLRFSAPQNATLPQADAQLVIAANDAPALARPLATMRPLTVDENDGWAEFAITLSAPGTDTATLRYSALGLTAGNTDLLAVGTPNVFNATLSFEPGRTVRSFRVPIADDTLAEGPEAIQVTLTNPIALDLAADRELIALYDNDGPGGVPALSIADAPTDESNGLARVVVTLDRPASVPLFVSWGTTASSATDSADYPSASGILSFAPGEVRQSLLLPIVDDRQPEDTEVFQVDLGRPSTGVLADGSAAVVIARSDLPVSARPNLTVDPVRVSENQPWVEVLLRLDRPAATPITLTYSTSNVTAASPGDFRAAFGPVSFPAGATSASVRFALVDDKVAEPVENFSFNLVPNPAVNLLSVNTLISIVDDDAAGGQFVFGPNALDRREGDGQTTLLAQVERLGNLSQPASVNWTVVAGSADAGDFVGGSLPAGRLDFAAGEGSRRVEIVVAGDTTLERHEDFSLVLGAASGATLTGTSLPGRLRNDDPVPRSGPPALGQDGSFLFDPVYYLWKYPELAATVPLAGAAGHYLNTGAAQGRAPNAWFDAAWYAGRWPDLTPLNLPAATLFQHFNLFGVWEGRAPGPLFAGFDGGRYLAENPDVAAYVDANVADFLGSRSNGAIAHYIIYGAAEQRPAYEAAGQPVLLEYLWI